MAITEEEKIYNLALGQIGDYQVTDGNTGTKQYKICQRYYDNARQRTLRAHPWNESTKRVIIPQQEFGPIFEFDFQYAEPSDSLKIMSISEIGIDLTLWQVESGFIITDISTTPQTWTADIKYAAGEYVTLDSITYLCNVSNTAATATSPDTNEVTWTTAGGDYAIIFARYVWDNQDPTTYSEDLKNAIAVQLASLISTSLENDPKTKNALIQEFEQVIMPKARSVDAQEGKPRRYFNSSWTRSRWGFFGGRNR